MIRVTWNFPVHFRSSFYTRTQLFECVWTFCGVGAYRIKIKKMNILLSAPKMNSSTHLNETRHFPVLSPTIHKNQDFFIIFQNIKKILRNEDHIFLNYDNTKKIKKIMTSGYCTWTCKLGDHSLSMYATFSKKLTFLTSCNTRIEGITFWFFLRAY